MNLWRVVVAVSVCSWAAIAVAAPLRDEIEVRDAEGTIYGKVVICNDCKTPTDGGKKPCHPGAADGWMDDKPCGSCLLKSNADTLIMYPYDLAITGKLVDRDGNSVAKRFVKMFLPNGWGVRSRTSDKGSFRLLLGATDKRKGSHAIEVDLGKRIDSITEVDESFSLFLMPVDYKPCSGSQPDSPARKKAPQT